MREITLAPQAVSSGSHQLTALTRRVPLSLQTMLLSLVIGLVGCSDQTKQELNEFAHSRGVKALPDGSPKRIEVKTTQGPASTPFYISLNELLASRNDASSYAIYRVFDYRPDSDQVKFFELLGDVELSCGLEPVSFRAYPGNGLE
jgi:hypothetical protein